MGIPLDSGHLRRDRENAQAKQAEIWNTKPWILAKEGTVNDFEKILQGNYPSLTSKEMTGPYGETLLHAACLFQNYSVAKFLLDHAPRLLNQVYIKQPYTGETALHLAIISGNVKLVRLLLERGASTDFACSGDFFQRGSSEGKVYYGEYPLTFAACIEDENKSKELIQLLVQHGASLLQQDSQEKNTILHILVINNRPTIYRFVLDLFHFYHPKLQLDQIPNRQGLTPLALAASLVRSEVFEAIMEGRKRILWVYGPWTASVYRLDEIDTFHGLTTRSFGTALEMAVYHSGRSKMSFQSSNDRARFVQKTPIKQLIEHKWEQFAWRLLYFWLGCYFAFLVIFSMVILKPSFLLDETGKNRAGLYCPPIPGAGCGHPFDLF